MIVQDVLKQLAEDLKSFGSTETIFGEPIDVQGSLVIPVCKLTVGYGAGGGEGEGEGGDKKGGQGTGKGSGAGGGGGVKIEPAALVIAKDGEISVVGIQAKESRLGKLLEMIPDAIEKFQAQASKGDEEDSGSHDDTA